jgi:transcriptional regulator with XRE-family HTH domain
MPTHSKRLRLVLDDQSTVHVGMALKGRREAAGLTQEQAAARAGITRNALSALEKKQYPDPHLSTLLALMLTYEVQSVEALLGPVPSQLIAGQWQAEGWLGGKPATKIGTPS